MPLPEEVPVDTEDIPQEKTPVKPKGKQARTKSRQVSALTKIVAEIDKAPARRTSVASQRHEDTPDESVQQNPDPVPDVVEEHQDEPSLPVKKRGRPPKARKVDNDNEEATGTRRGRPRTCSQPIDDSDNTQTTEDANPIKALVIPKRKRASTRATRTLSTVVTALPEIEEKEKELSPDTKTSEQTSTTPGIEVPEPEADLEPEVEFVDPEPVAASTSRRGRKPGRGRGRSTLARTSVITSTPLQEAPAKAGRRGRPVSKRQISDIDNDITDDIEPPAKRKASGLRSMEKIPTPSEDSESEVFEDSKSTFSDIEDVVAKPVKRTSRAAPSKSRSRMLTYEEQEAEDAPSTIYHSADDYQSSPTQLTLLGKSKREMVNNAKKELQEEIWREKVANGEVGLGGAVKMTRKRTLRRRKERNQQELFVERVQRVEKRKEKGKKGRQFRKTKYQRMTITAVLVNPML